MLAIDTQLHHLATQTLIFLPRLIISTLIFILFLIAAALCKKILAKANSKIKHDSALFPLIARFLQSTILIIGLITALGTLGINVTALVASLGLFGFAAGFALKDLLSNTLAGVMILLYKPFVIDDVIAVNTSEGKVKEINLRYTVLENEEGPVLVPNSLVLNNVVKIIR